MRGTIPYAKEGIRQISTGKLNSVVNTFGKLNAEPVCVGRQLDISRHRSAHRYIPGEVDVFAIIIRISVEAQDIHNSQVPWGNVIVDTGIARREEGVISRASAPISGVSGTERIEIGERCGASIDREISPAI